MKKIIQSYIKLKSKFKPKNDFEFENANYNRLSLINRALNKYDQKKCKYLEIGLGDCNNYNSVSLDINNKYGVDPAFDSVNNIHGVRSDEFFQNNNETFDVIFIDGGHEYNDALQDIINCRKLANRKTVLLLDDVLYNNENNIYHFNSGPTKAWNELISKNFISKLDYQEFKEENIFRSFITGNYEL